MKERTYDHFTPRCIGKALGWKVGRVEGLTEQERIMQPHINDPRNIQVLSPKRHKLKDQTTPWELQAVKRNGGAKTLFEHANEYVILRKGIPYAN